jgi:hypothetical protein
MTNADNSVLTLNRLKKRVGTIARNERESEIFMYIARNARREDCLFAGTVSGTAKAARTSYYRAASACKKLGANGLLAKERKGLYRVNPALFVVLTEL